MARVLTLILVSVLVFVFITISRTISRFELTDMGFIPAGVCAPFGIPISIRDNSKFQLGGVFYVTSLMDSGEVITSFIPFEHNLPSVNVVWDVHLVCPNFRAVVFVIIDSQVFVNFPLFDFRVNKEDYSNIDIIRVFYLPEWVSERLKNFHIDIMIVKSKNQEDDMPLVYQEEVNQKYIAPSIKGFVHIGNATAESLDEALANYEGEIVVKLFYPDGEPNGSPLDRYKTKWALYRRL